MRKVTTQPEDAAGHEEAARGVHLSPSALDALAPLHLRLRVDGRILSAGRTIQKIFGDAPLIGACFLERFRVLRPRGCASSFAKLATLGSKLVAETRTDPAAQLRGLLIELEDSKDLLVNLALGENAPEAAERFGLRAKDFSAADSSVDLLHAATARKRLEKDARDLTNRLQQEKARAEALAQTDPLTGLANRLAITTRLEQETERLRDIGGLAVLHIDLDNFKLVNDQCGHAAGDAALRFAGEVLSRAVRDTDIVGRIGGDEFIIALLGNIDEATVTRIGERIVREMRSPAQLDGRTCRLGASIGVVVLRGAADRPADQILADADLALQEAKRAGRSRCVFFDPTMRAAQDRIVELAVEIEAGLEDGAFVPFFQPQIDVRSGEVTGVEALARWRHPARGLLAPGAFLPTAEARQLTTRIDAQIMRHAFARAKLWREEGVFSGVVSINVTADRLKNPTFVDELLAAAEETDLPPNTVGLELLETVLLDADESVIVENARKLARSGFAIKLDDFGVGRASIATLRTLPVAQIKIDRSLVAGVDDDVELQKMTGAVLALARSLGVGTLAEGVETIPELEWLRLAGCEEIQGYGVARPMDPDALTLWLEKRSEAAGFLEPVKPPRRAFRPA